MTGMFSYSKAAVERAMTSRTFLSKESQGAVGDGIMPARKMFEALIAAKYQGSVDLEYEIHPDDPMPGVIASFAQMRGILAGMGFTGQG